MVPTTSEGETGGKVLALAHNGNLANGLMFSVDAQYTGREIDENHVLGAPPWGSRGALL
ncbi:MAG: DUF3604 domain-containing protein [Candidatus Competibacterales bacterium]